MDWLNRLKTKFQRIYFTNNDRVIGIDLFHDYFEYQVLLVSRNAEEYIAGIYPVSSKSHRLRTEFKHVVKCSQIPDTRLVSKQMAEGLVGRYLRIGQTSDRWYL